MSKKTTQTVVTNLKINGREYSVKPEVTEDGTLRITATGIEQGLKTVYQKDYSFKEIRRQLRPIKKYDSIETAYQDLREFLQNNELKLTNRGDSIDLVIDEENVVCLSLDKIYSSYIDDIKKMKEENAKLRAEIKKLKNAYKELQDEFDSKIEELEDIIREKDEKIQELDDDLEEYKKINDGLLLRSKNLEKELEEKDQKISELYGELDDCKEMVQDLKEKENALNDLKRKYGDMDKELRSMKSNQIKRSKTENLSSKKLKLTEAMLAAEKKKHRPDIHVTGKEILKVSDVFENNEEISLLEKRLGIKPLKLQLLYKGTRDDDTAVVFHEFVKGEAKTITVIKTTDGQRFGGYTAETWDGINVFKEDPKAFIFSFNKLKYYNIKENGISIWCYPKYGPIFGGYQIDIFDHFLTKNFNKTGVKGIEYKTTEDYELNDGTENFLVEELEVYKVEK